MSSIQLILSLNQQTIQILHKVGYIRKSIYRDVEMYEFYMNELKSVGCMQARTNTAEKFHTSEETIGRVIRRMK